MQIVKSKTIALAWMNFKRWGECSPCCAAVEKFSEDSTYPLLARSPLRRRNPVGLIFPPPAAMITRLAHQWCPQGQMMMSKVNYILAMSRKYFRAFEFGYYK